MSLLLLGGTAEGRELAERLADLSVVTSYAGRLTDPLLPVGGLRTGGFGGVEGLRAYVDQAGVRAVVDATHPFAEQISRHAVQALTGVPLLRLQRPAWVQGPGDRWERAPTVARAAAQIRGRRALVTTGRHEAAAYAGTGAVLRCVEAPDPVPPGCSVLVARGPYDLAGERALLRGFEVLVTKDSGGDRAKLDAARGLGLPVLLVDRPPAPAAEMVTETVTGVEAAERWVRARL